MWNSATAKEVDTVARADVISATAITKRRECMKARIMLLAQYPPNCCKQLAGNAIIMIARIIVVLNVKEALGQVSLVEKWPFQAQFQSIMFHIYPPSNPLFLRVTAFGQSLGTLLRRALLSEFLPQMSCICIWFVFYLDKAWARFPDGHTVISLRVCSTDGSFPSSTIFQARRWIREFGLHFTLRL